VFINKGELKFFPLVVGKGAEGGTYFSDEMLVCGILDFLGKNMPVIISYRTSWGV
jgi:hypothetical protein